MPVINKRENDSAILVMGLVAVLVFVVPVSSPVESVTLLDTIRAQLSSNEIVANSITWNDFQQWMILNDTTIYHEYNNDTYYCVHFSTDLRNNTQNDGITIYRAVVWIKGNVSHSINYGCFVDDSGKPICALIEPQTGEIFFDVKDYIHSNKKWNIVSIIIKESAFGENEKSIKRIY